MYFFISQNITIPGGKRITKVVVRRNLYLSVMKSLKRMMLFRMLMWTCYLLGTT